MLQCSLTAHAWLAACWLARSLPASMLCSAEWTNAQLQRNCASLYMMQEGNVLREDVLPERHCCIVPQSKSASLIKLNIFTDQLIRNLAIANRSWLAASHGSPGRIQQEK